MGQEVIVDVLSVTEYIIQWYAQKLEEYLWNRSSIPLD